jgi:hypothetical protein
MPARETLQRAERDLEQGKSHQLTLAEFIREEMQHRREGKYGARSSRLSPSAFRKRTGA